MESVKPPGVDDCPSRVTQESYQYGVVVSGVEGIVLVGGNVVVVVGTVVVIDLNLFNFSCRRRRRRASLSLLFFSALMLPLLMTCLLLVGGCWALVV